MLQNDVTICIMRRSLRLKPNRTAPIDEHFSIQDNVFHFFPKFDNLNSVLSHVYYSQMANMIKFCKISLCWLTTPEISLL